MFKFLVVLLSATLIATTFARSTTVSIFQLPPNDSETNEIDGDINHHMTEEKKLALETNEVKPSSIAPLLPTPAIEEVRLNSLEEYTNDMEQTSVVERSGLINQSKAPSTIFEYVMDFLYGVCQRIFSKLFS